METNECTIMNEQDYISHWGVNAKQHFDNGDYEWLCGFIKHFTGDHCGIVEIGCGAGYSSLAFVQNGFDVAAIDVNSEALKATLQLLQKHEYQNRIITAQFDAVHEMNGIISFLDGNRFLVDIVVLCNPGGSLKPDLSQVEYKLLRMFGFKEDEIIQRALRGEIHLLHKWSLIYAACSLSIMMDKMLIIVDRGSKVELEQILGLIQHNAGIHRIASDLRKIGNEPDDGIPLGKTNTEQYWGVALYNPVEGLLYQEDN